MDAPENEGKRTLCRVTNSRKRFAVWIYKLGPEGKDPFGNPQYEYAVVSNWVKYPVTVLVRDPDTFRAKYEARPFGSPVTEFL